MNKLPELGKTHPAAARTLIVCLHLLLFLLALLTARLLGTTGNNELPAMLLAGFAIYLFIRYPQRPLVSSEILKHNYLLRKRQFNLVICALGFILPVLVFTAETPVTGFYDRLQGSNTGKTGTVSTVDSPRKYLSIPDFTRKYHDKSISAKEKRQVLKQQIMAIQKDSNLSKSAQTWLIILTVLVAVGLVYLIAGLSCSLSCAGSTTAATLLLIFGIPAVVLLAIFAIRRIKGKRRRKRTQDTPSPGM